MIDDIIHRSITKIAFRNWLNWIGQDIRIAWSERANMIHRRPISRHYVTIPIEVGESDTLSLNILLFLSMDWSNMVRLLRWCITQKPKGIDPKYFHCFGDERVRLIPIASKI